MKSVLHIVILFTLATLSLGVAVRLWKTPSRAPATEIAIREDLTLPRSPEDEDQEGDRATQPNPRNPDPSRTPPPPAPPQEIIREEPTPVVRIIPAPRPPETAPPPPVALGDAEFYARFAPAVVQIFCRTQALLFSASGVIVNERGLILTNAHVADVVKKSGEEQCEARHGNPASSFAGVSVVFVADTTAKIPDTQVPQRDLAFLTLRDARESFAVAPISLAVLDINTPLYTLGYPSEFLQGVAATDRSNLVFSILPVGGLADIDGNGNTAEGYIFKGGIILQQGSSGTALFRRDGSVAGIIFATTKGATTADRNGIALMTPYIDAILQLETGQGLAEFIASH